MNKIRPGIYRHYKNKDYLVLGLATHSETQEHFVVYRALYGEYGLWIRPYSMFIEQINKPEVNYQGPRFKLVQEF